MSDEFTYQVPDGKQYMLTLRALLEKKGEEKLHHLLRNAECSIAPSGSFSRKRWNAMWTEIVFRVPVEDYSQHDLADDDETSLIRYCDLIMPTEAGFDVMNVEFTPVLDSGLEEHTLEQDLEEIEERLSSEETDFRLPPELMDKGREMTEAYLYLFAVENYLRLFIEAVGKDHFGENYFDQLSVSRDLRKGIQIRKDQESKNQWMSVRGQSDLFYLDFGDLKKLIVNNWTLFEDYFPDQSWINSKIDELVSCRNLVAHNSYLGKHEREVVRINFRSIVRQLNPVLSDL